MTRKGETVAKVVRRIVDHFRTCETDPEHDEDTEKNSAHYARQRCPGNCSSLDLRQQTCCFFSLTHFLFALPLEGPFSPAVYACTHSESRVAHQRRSLSFVKYYTASKPSTSSLTISPMLRPWCIMHNRRPGEFDRSDAVIDIQRLSLSIRMPARYRVSRFLQCRPSCSRQIPAHLASRHQVRRTCPVLQQDAG